MRGVSFDVERGDRIGIIGRNGAGKSTLLKILSQITEPSTGRITLRGRVLPIGGLKEKLLAALRGGIKTVLIPQENAKDLADIPENVKNALEIIPVEHLDDVLPHALTRMPEAIDWSEDDAEAAALAARANEEAARTAH